ncbi:MAG TPA: hypothetical protein PK425_11495 [Syntrophales bacterium]|nr:hypothetical protein [Syntrophales bacterium]
MSERISLPFTVTWMSPADTPRGKSDIPIFPFSLTLRPDASSSADSMRGLQEFISSRETMNTMATATSAMTLPVIVRIFLVESMTSSQL